MIDATSSNHECGGEELVSIMGFPISNLGDEGDERFIESFDTFVGLRVVWRGRYAVNSVMEAVGTALVPSELAAFIGDNELGSQSIPQSWIQ